MYGIEKENLISFIPQIESIGDRLKNDIFGGCTLCIKEFKHNGNVYTIKGSITVTLSPIHKERTLFEVKAIVSANKLVLKNTQYSKWENINCNIEENNKPIITGDRLETVYLFTVHTKGNTNYLVHSVNDSIRKIYTVHKNYSIKDGFNKELKPINTNQMTNSEGVNSSTKHQKRLNLKSLIRKIR